MFVGFMSFARARITSRLAAIAATVAVSLGMTPGADAAGVAPAVVTAAATAPGGGPLSCEQVEEIVQAAIGGVEAALKELEALPPNPNLLQITAAVTAATLHVTNATTQIVAAILELELIQLAGIGCPTLEAVIRALEKLTDIDALLDFVTAQLPLLLNPLLPPGQFNEIKNGIIDVLQNTVDLLEEILLQLSEAPPANDDCSNAAAAGDGTVKFTTVGATTSGAWPFGCAGLVPPLQTHDVWFAYEPTCDGVATATVCGADFDTLLAVYTGSCDDLVLLGCNDDDPNCGAGSTVTFPVNCDETVFIRVGGVNAEGVGTLSIDCSGAECPSGGPDPVPCEELQALLTSITDTVLRVIDKLEALPPGPTPLEVVNTVVAVNGQLLGLTANLAQAILSLEVLEALGEGCPTLEAIIRVLIKLTDVEALIGQVIVNVQLLLNPLLPPEELDAIVDGILEALSNVVQLLEDALVQISTGPPANDNCEDAAPVSGAVAFVTTGATDDGPPLPPGCVNGLPPLVVFDIWYTYEAECDGIATASVCNAADFDTVVVVYTGTCDDLEAVACSDDASGCGETSAASFRATCGETYIIRIAGINEEGAGELTVACEGDPCGPASCFADLNHDGMVDGADLGLLLASWGQEGEADLDETGNVDGADLGLLLAAWGPC